MKDFVIESWGIEGVVLTDDSPKLGVFVALHRDFITDNTLTVPVLASLAAAFTKGYGRLRDQAGMDVRVGSHAPLKGGNEVSLKLAALCAGADGLTPYELHQRFEQLHPFLDGNGRVGRLLWLYSMVRHGQHGRALALGFLHNWYYQSLDAYRP